MPKELASLGKKANITPQLPTTESSATWSAQDKKETLDRFGSMAKGIDFDTAFVNHEVDDHQKVISEVQALESQAQNADVKALLTKTIPTLQKHLDKAQALQKQLSGVK